MSNFSVFCVFLNKEWFVWLYLYIFVKVSKGAITFVAARCKFLDTSAIFSSSASLCTNNRLRKEVGMNDAIPVLFAPPWFVYLHNYVISKPILNKILVDSNCFHDVFLSRDIVQTHHFSWEGIYRRVIHQTALHL